MDNAVWGRLGLYASAAAGVSNLPGSESGVQAASGGQPGLLSLSHPYGATMIMGIGSAALLLFLYISLPD
jgi:hypothetical protein